MFGEKQDELCFLPTAACGGCVQWLVLSWPEHGWDLTQNSQAALLGREGYRALGGRARGWKSCWRGIGVHPQRILALTWMEEKNVAACGTHGGVWSPNPLLLWIGAIKLEKDWSERCPSLLWLSSLQPWIHPGVMLAHLCVGGISFLQPVGVATEVNTLEEKDGQMGENWDRRVWLKSVQSCHH